MKSTMWTMWSTQSLAVCLVLILHVAGQASTNVMTCVSDYTWSLNSMGQTPCLVAAFLQALCGVPHSTDAISDGELYPGPGPGNNTPCACNTVTYTAVSACGGCQGRTFEDWTTWSTNCVEGVEIASFPKPIPGEVIVPDWMYINVTLIGNKFDPILAQQVVAGMIPTSSNVATLPSQTSTSSNMATSSSATSSTPSATAGLAEGGSSPKLNRSIIGAILAGAIAGLIALAVIVLHFYRPLRVRKAGEGRNVYRYLERGRNDTVPQVQERSFVL